MYKTAISYKSSCIIRKKFVIIPNRKLTVNKRLTNIKPKATSFTGVETNTIVYYVSKSIYLFTMFYCGLNYIYYKKFNDKNDK